jgi:threonine synthase
MKFYSLHDKTHRADFREATLRGLAPDKGLYFPEKVPLLSVELLHEMEQMSPAEMALRIIQPYVGEVITMQRLMQIVEDTLSFPIPLVALTEDIYTLELFHGPTLAFKDVGARFMSRCLSYFMEASGNHMTVLVATSGDTGGAVASGFYHAPGIDVVILYPSGKISHVQEMQLTRHGGNITAIEIEGNFDDCQRLVKQAFADKEITEAHRLTSANSINIARWLPQQLYYFLAWQQWPYKKEPPVISVPSGNFGNLCAGMLAERSGLPFKHFIAACNANDTVPHFFEHGRYKAKPSVTTFSNAMDVGDPNNFPRILELYENNFDNLQQTLHAYSIMDDTTRQAIMEVYHLKNYVMDPHGAVGYAALQHHLKLHPGSKGIFLETAHPSKFQTVLETPAGPSTFPHTIMELMKKEKRSIMMKADYQQLKEFLMQKVV